MPRRIERKHDHVAVVTMNTNKVNAQNPAFFGDLHAAIGARIVHYEFTLAAEAADNIDFPVHLGHRDLSAGGGHWGRRSNGQCFGRRPANRAGHR